jgi:hypothetical protein
MSGDKTNPLVKFESSWTKSEARDALRDVREKALEKAKEKAENRKGRDDKEQKWMLKGSSNHQHIGVTEDGITENAITLIFSRTGRCYYQKTV